MLAADTKILLVDDMKGVRILVARLLIQLGYHQILEAADGHEAFSMLENAEKQGANFGLVIADMRMPGVDGLQLLLQIRNSKALAKLPFVMMAAESDKESMVNAFKMGANNCLVKPASISLLKDILEKLN